jgi:hypothetical protein
MHIQSIFSELGKTGITVNLGSYYSHKKYLVGGLTLDLRFQTFILLKISNIYITLVNQMYIEIEGAGKTKTTDPWELHRNL